MKRVVWIFWLAFIVGGVAGVVFSTVFDPQELHPFGQTAGASGPGTYSLGFLLFWASAACLSALTCFLRRPAEEINRRRPVPGTRSIKG